MATFLTLLIIQVGLEIRGTLSPDSHQVALEYSVLGETPYERATFYYSPDGEAWHPVGVKMNPGMENPWQDRFVWVFPKIQMKCQEGRYLCKEKILMPGGCSGMMLSIRGIIPSLCIYHYS